MFLHTFENPLNEKSRMYLRVEYLFEQLTQSASMEHPWQYIAFFKALLDLQELLERSDPRMELLKDFDLQNQKLVQWAKHPGTDRELVGQLEMRIQTVRQMLPRVGKVASHLRDDRLLGALRPRFNIPGGCCHFDVPSLHLWLTLPADERKAQVQAWMDDLQSVRDAVELLLWFWRESTHYQTRLAKNGFFQDVAEQAQLIRICFDGALRHYPSVSGNRGRFAIRFLPLDEDQATPDITFQLACC